MKQPLLISVGLIVYFLFEGVSSLYAHDSAFDAWGNSDTLKSLPMLPDSTVQDGIPTVLLPADSLSSDSLGLNLESDSLATDSTMTLPNTLASSLSIAEDTVAKPLYKVTPWKEYKEPLERTMATDSLFRWTYRSDLADHLASIPGSLPHRTAIQMRSDAVILGTALPQQQQLNWYSMPMQDPLTDQPMMQHLPLTKLRALQMKSVAGHKQLDFTNRDFHVREPWTSLNFEESEGEYQNLEFSLTRNFDRRWNTQIGYRQYRDGNLYRMSDSEGNQIFVQNTYNINKKFRLLHQTHRSDLKVDDPYGYQLQQASLFPFNPFTANPNRQARQNRFFSVHRFLLEGRADSLSASNLRIQYYRKRNERSINAGADTTDYEIITHGLGASKRLTLGKLIDSNFDFNTQVHRLEGQLQDVNLPENVLEVRTEASLHFNLSKKLSIYAGGSAHFRNESISRLALAQMGGFRFRKSSTQYLEAQLFNREQLPSIAQIGAFTGSNLPIMQNRGIEAEASLMRGPWTLKLQGSYSDRQNQILIPAAYTINNQTSPLLENQVLMQGSYQLMWEGKRIYSHHRMNFLQIERPTLIDQRLFSGWVLGWKNYIFKKAAFLDLSAELRNDLLPFYGLGYDPTNQLWQPQDFGRIPAFRSVLDLRASARIRSMIILVRWENLLDSMTQLGYFETIGYPAPYRRIVFGIRALFKN